MDPKELLFAFEKKYPFLYDITVEGVPVYTCHRDGVLACLQGREQAQNTVFAEEKGKIFPKRIWDSAGKLFAFRKSQTLVFTSSMFRRDHGRNLAAQWLLEQYPKGVVFEWPSRTQSYDGAYFTDPERKKYCPLDFYIVCYKLYIRLFFKKYRKLMQDCSDRLAAAFAAAPEAVTGEEKAAFAYLQASLPETYAATACSHAVFRWLFRGYKNATYAIDLWGSARENIIPVLPGKPESIELQHGIITAYHPGYIYPEFARDRSPEFFGRTLLVYGEKTKQLLTEGSVFTGEQIRVIGNPRIKIYKSLYTPQTVQRKQILFTSQPYEQDGVATGYYSVMVRYLQKLSELLQQDPEFSGYRLAVKLHPRENNGVAEIYRQKLPSVQVHGNATQLYQLLGSSWLQLTVSSTSLYEAAEFDTPTVALAFAGTDHEAVFGFRPQVAATPEELVQLLQKLKDPACYQEYLDHLKEKTKQYM